MKRLLNLLRSYIADQDEDDEKPAVESLLHLAHHIAALQEENEKLRAQLRVYQSIPEPGTDVRAEEEYLIARGWDHTLTDEDGDDTWHYPWELRPQWPDWTKKMHGTQHYWDRPEAVALQRQIDGLPKSPQN